MAKRNRQNTNRLIEKRIKDGRGQGKGSEYQPWLLIQDVASQGLATRIKGIKSKRVQHFMSNFELSYFYLLEWSPVIYDIREQYPLLPLEETIAIAELAGINHPIDPQTKEPIVMTTDFLLTVDQKIDTIEQARTLRQTKDLQSHRTIEKLEIERLYWQERNIDWGIVTEQEIPENLVKNLSWLHPYHDLENLYPLSENDIQKIKQTLESSMSINNIPLNYLTSECDDRLCLSAGTSLSVVRYLMANRMWIVSMNECIEPNQPLELISTQKKVTQVNSWKEREVG
ncbi:Tn7-like transposition protein A [Geminocystis sp. NIES-3708]|uniref:heteromeric transposase endonuclease subunit TnsA n=1 Tax=Geminocystis sp. NIES-3708 TaxID=1615909 RepID=UPI0005FC41CF|nr:heteromeric transposase endonuclease subunit TnsA [Geminocystis sp. NIES-3708]BAQ60815.1 Tn7-like transposition protein A [Geminocystis sp. NIES-3708]